MTRFHALAAPLLDNEELAPPGGSGTGAPARITCEFCECSLAASGEVLRRSARAKELLTIEEKIEALTADLAAARDETSQVQQQLDAAKLELAAAKKKGSSIF